MKPRKQESFVVRCPDCGKESDRVVQEQDVREGYVFSFKNNEWDKKPQYAEGGEVTGYYSVCCGRLLDHQDEIDERING